MRIKAVVLLVFALAVTAGLPTTQAVAQDADVAVRFPELWRVRLRESLTALPEGVALIDTRLSHATFAVHTLVGGKGSGLYF